MGNQITGLPGYRTAVAHTPRRVRRSQQDVAYREGGGVINGSLSGDASNTSYLDVLRPGKVMARQSSGGKYRNAIWGKSTAAYADNDTTITVSAATATEIARIKAAAGGGDLSAYFVGPPSAAGTVAATAITITAVGATTITVGDLNLNKVTDSLIIPADLTDGTWCLVDDGDEIKLSDELNNRVDQPFPRPLIGGHIDTAQIIDYPADASTKTWLKGKLSTTDGEAKFHFMDAI